VLRQIQRKISGDKDPDKTVTVTVTVPDGYVINEKFREVIEKTLYDIGIWVFPKVNKEDDW